MRLKEYGTKPQERVKSMFKQPGLLLVGVDVSQAKPSACLGPQTGLTCRKLEFTHSREGCQLFEQTRRTHVVKNNCRHLLLAMEPSGISWQGLYDTTTHAAATMSALCAVKRCATIASPCRRPPAKPMKKMPTACWICCDQGKFFLPGCTRR